MTTREYLRWLQEAKQLLIDACGTQLGNIHVIIVYEVSQQGVEFTLPAAEPADDGEEWPAEAISLPERADDLFPLRRVHRRLLEVMTAAPIPPKQLARLAGYVRCNSYVRAALTELVRWGRAVRTADGYKLPA